MSWSWWLVGVGLGVCACAEPALSPAAEAGGLPDVAKVFGEVAKVRELASQGVPRTRFLRRGEYRALLINGGEGEEQGIDGFAKQLGLTSQRATFSTEQARLLGSDGVYRQRDKTIYVLDDPSRRFPVLLEQVVAHELVHALQDQHGLLPRPEQELALDEGLARRALIEGDATLGMLLYQERHWHTPRRRIAERVRRGFAEEPISRYVGATNTALLGSPPYQQELVLFPYRAGAAFLAAVLAAGGYELVGKAFAAPPVSTAQVLHPERYARGELPIAVPPPRAPDGYTVTSSGTLGELLTRSLLLRCNSAERAIAAAAGWRGDWVTTLRQGSEELVAQQWVTGSDAQARELAAALRTPCADAADPAQLFVVEQGARVVAVRGGNASLAAQLTASWLSRPLTTPAVRRPFGAIELPSVAAPRVVAKPTVSDGWLQFPAAGVALPVPAGFSVRTEGGVVLSSHEDHASIELRLLLGEYFDGAAEQILIALSRSMELAIAYSNVVKTGEPYSVRLGTGTALAQDFEHDGTVAKGRVLAVPLCGGASLLAIIQYYGSAESAEAKSVAALRTLPGSTWCDALAEPHAASH